LPNIFLSKESRPLSTRRRNSEEKRRKGGLKEKKDVARAKG
jgi:hypothetical protein